MVKAPTAAVQGLFGGAPRLLVSESPSLCDGSAGPSKDDYPLPAGSGQRELPGGAPTPSRYATGSPWGAGSRYPGELKPLSTVADTFSMIEEGIPFGERYSSAEYREWIRAQLTDREQLLIARAILDLPPARWRILGKQGYAVVTNRRIFIVHADAAYSGRTRKSRYPHVMNFDAVPPPEIAREVALKDVALLPRSPDDRTVKMLIRGDPRRLRFRKPGDAADFVDALRRSGRA